jgi:hypothetical protein
LTSRSFLRDINEEVSTWGDANRSIGFVVILVLYLTIGIMAAAGCVAIGRRFLRPKLEQVFYGFFLSLRSRCWVPPASGSRPC